MKRVLRRIMLGTFLVFLCAILGTAATVFGANGRVHNVVKGDTLWDVTQQYLDNPFFWPKVWQYNPQIKNPHLIYPGEEVRIPSPEELANIGTATVSTPKPQIEAPRTVVGRHIVERGLFESAGFILPADQKDWPGAIVSTWEEKTLLVARDVVEINRGKSDGVNEGELFQIIRIGNETVHPKTHKKMGRQVTIQGILKINSVGQKISKATIIKSYNPIRVGDRIRPYHPMPLVGTEDLTTEDKSIGGVIVMNTRGKANLASRDTVYLDVGSKDDVLPGDRFLIYRDGIPFQVSAKNAAGIEPADYPPDIMGELVVLNTMDQTSTAVIVEELYEIKPGDRIKYIPRSLPSIKKYNID
ncbi:MAG: LysM peptidoglycan-binding domain-containing protein [Deltaproteobacteria bacterium]|nr:LysM peptidoglycan-binding domain-containing protein [Deltaproteobacteria bacterium]